MTEADVDQLLARTARRLRLQRALRTALAALGAGLLLAAAVVLWSRLKNYDLLLAVGLALPPLIGLVALFGAYLRDNPPMDQVALLLDQRAGSSEHLVTWYEFRANPAHATNDTQREFLTAQREAMLQKAAAIDPRMLVPVRLPEWSRIVLLAFLLLCCAWLTPPPEAPVHYTEETHRRHTQNAGQAGGADAASNAADEMPSVEMLSMTDQLKLQLLASNPMLSEARKADAYKDLQAKLAGIPDSQLTPLDRELLSQLRPASANTAKPDPKASDSSTTNSGKATNPQEDSHPPGPVSSASLPQDPAKAFTAIRTQLPAELQLRLESYYRRSEHHQ